MPKQMRRLQTRYEQRTREIAGRYERVAGWMGASRTQIEADLPDMVYVRLANGTIVRAVNKLAPLQYNFPVVISRSDKSAYWEVVELRQAYNVPLSGMKNHHEQHEFPNGDTVWIRGAQFLPFNVLPYNGMTVVFYGGVVEEGNTHYLVSNQYIDMSNYTPDVGAVWALLEIFNGELIVTLSKGYESKELLLPSNIPPTSGGLSVCAIALYTGQTEIRIADDNTNDFVDLRFGRQAVSKSEVIENNTRTETNVVNTDAKAIRASKVSKIFANTNFS